MRFGLQKLTLLDFPGQVACTIFSRGCNFTCPFCHNASLVNGSDELPFTEQEIVDFLKKRQGILDGVCFTGGEPLLCSRVTDLAELAKSLGYKVKLDTNGSLPELLQRAVDKKLVDYVAMDIKTSPEKYAAVSGSDQALAAVKKSVEFLQSGATEFEFRTTVVNTLHELSDFAAIGQWIGPVKHYFLQPFADSGDILSGNAADFAVSNDFMQKALTEVRRFVPSAAIRGR